MTQGIIILDFGSQYNQLIARRIREFGVYTEIIPYNTSIEEIKKHNPKGIILSGGPSSVFGDEAALVEKELFEMGVPVLGICYGMQLISHLLGGEVKKGEKGEYGKSELTVLAQNSLFAGVPEQSTVWMSHFDEVMTAPIGFTISGKSNIDIAAIANEDKKIFAVQFHPEVTHSEYGSTMLENFVFNICQAEKNWVLKDFIETEIARIKEVVGDKKVILGLSGGVDSSVAAVLIHRAIGDQLTCIFVDTGLLRKDEGKKVMENY
ncbi:glutamine-hydrolyzing GMP synthase, partial [Empedobacter sp. UBA7620]